MSTTEDDNKTWTTWEELLLAFAVKRHGCRNWDSVATELQSRTKLITSPDACKLKFHDLRRRFRNDVVEDIDEDEEDLGVPWAEDLRRLRVDELRAQVSRFDSSIESLQSKVKRLEKDREQSVKEEEEAKRESDLERSENNRRDAGNSDSDGENQSVNASNSTGPNKANEMNRTGEIEPEVRTGMEEEKTEPGSVQPGPKQNEMCSTSQDESTDSIDKGKKNKGGGSGTKTDSDVQSSATLSKKRQWNKESSVEEHGSLRTEESGPLINVLSLVRSHKDASFFECRLQIQESKMYNNIIRQHMDLQTIQNNLDSGLYASSHLNFYRDLMLTFSNAIIFYSKSSPEYKAALELRSVVSEKKEEQFKQSQRSEEKHSSAPSSPRVKPVFERSDSLPGKNKSSGSGPIVVCRKRSSISSKGNSTSKGEQHQSDVGDEMKTASLADLKPSPMEERGLLGSTKDRIVTGTRSLRRSNTSLKKPVTLPNATAAATTSDSNKKETTTASATEKKKEESSASKKDDNLAKKRGAADFLKRLKGNSPVKPKDIKSSGTKENSTTAGAEQKKKNGNGDKVDGRRKIATRQTESGKQTSKTEGGTSPTKRNVGRPSKKTPESATTAVKRARDTEASASVASKQPKKRTRKS